MGEKVVEDIGRWVWTANFRCDLLILFWLFVGLHWDTVYPLLHRVRLALPYIKICCPLCPITLLCDMVCTHFTKLYELYLKLKVSSRRLQQAQMCANRPSIWGVMGEKVVKYVGRWVWTADFHCDPPILFWLFIGLHLDAIDPLLHRVWLALAYRLGWSHLRAYHLPSDQVCTYFTKPYKLYLKQKVSFKQLERAQNRANRPCIWGVMGEKAVEPQL